MHIQPISTRNVQFTQYLDGWNLNLHVIFGNTHTFIIDTGLGTDSAAPLLSHIKGIDKPVIVINTHHHWDHVFGNAAFAGCTIVSHALCLQLMQKKYDAMLTQYGQYACGDTTMMLPSLVFEGSVCFPEDGVRLLHMPGHTIDTLCVWDEQDGVLNASDNIGDSMEDILPSLETDVETYRASIQACKALGARYCLSGHNTVQSNDVFDAILSAL